jgi:O-antigen ligase
MVRTVAFWLSLILIFVIPWENVVGVEGVGTASRVAGLAVAAFWALMVVVTGKFRKPRRFHLVVYLFVLWNVVSAFWSLNLEATMDRVQTYLQLLALVFVLWDLLTTPAALKAGMQAYVLGAYVAIGSTVANFRAGEQESVLRYSATGFNANDLGLILALGMPVAWYLAVSESNGRMILVRKAVNYAYVPAAVLAIMLSGSRGSLVAALPAFLFVIGSLTRLKLYVRVLAFVALAGSLFALQFLVPQSSFQRLATTGTSIAEADLGGRVGIWREGAAVFLEHPLLGVGSGAFRTAVGIDKVAHNVFLSILVEVGPIGFALFIAILAIAVHQALQQPKWEARLWLAVLLVWTLGASVHTWEQRKQTWLFLSLVVAGAGLVARRDQAVPQVTRHIGTQQIAPKREEPVYLEPIE